MSLVGTGEGGLEVAQSSFLFSGTLQQTRSRFLSCRRGQAAQGEQKCRSRGQIGAHESGQRTPPLSDCGLQQGAWGGSAPRNRLILS